MTERNDALLLALEKIFEGEVIFEPYDRRCADCDEENCDCVCSEEVP